MSKIIYSYDKHDYVIELYKTDAETLKPYVEKFMKQAEKRAEHYRDIHESGEATERQQSAMADAETAYDTMAGLLDKINKLIEP